MSNNEREFIKLCKTPQTADFMFKAMLCWLAHGEAFTKAVQKHLEQGNVEAMIEMVNRESQALA